LTEILVRSADYVVASAPLQSTRRARPLQLSGISDIHEPQDHTKKWLWPHTKPLRIIVKTQISHHSKETGFANKQGIFIRYYGSEVCPSGRLQKDSLGIGVSTRSRNATTTQSRKISELQTGNAKIMRVVSINQSTLLGWVL
jgi:hypothetical protein